MPNYPTPPKPPALLINQPVRPALVRPLEVLKRMYPDIGNMRIEERPMDDPLAFSNIIGQANKGENISLSPMLVGLGPEEAIADTLAHELQHVRQNRLGEKYDWGPKDNIYLGSPQEKAAFAEESKFQHRPMSVDTALEQNAPPQANSLWRSTTQGDEALNIFKEKILNTLKSLKP